MSDSCRLIQDYFAHFDISLATLELSQGIAVLESPQQVWNSSLSKIEGLLPEFAKEAHVCTVAVAEIRFRIFERRLNFKAVQGHENRM